MDINAEISDMKVALASLEAKAKALEKPKQWKPTVSLDWVDRANISTYTLLLKYVKEFGGDWEAAWNDNHGNYFIVYKHLPMTWEAIVSFRGCKGGAVYMSKECAEGLVAKLNSGEVVL
jgi:hypothetical protein